MEGSSAAPHSGDPEAMFRWKPMTVPRKFDPTHALAIHNLGYRALKRLGIQWAGPEPAADPGSGSGESLPSLLVHGRIRSCEEAPQIVVRSK